MRHGSGVWAGNEAAFYSWAQTSRIWARRGLHSLQSWCGHPLAFPSLYHKGRMIRQASVSVIGHLVSFSLVKFLHGSPSPSVFLQFLNWFVEVLFPVMFKLLQFVTCSSFFTVLMSIKYFYYTLGNLTLCSCVLEESYHHLKVIRYSLYFVAQC